jgi:hypothetical protein
MRLIIKLRLHKNMLQADLPFSSENLTSNQQKNFANSMTLTKKNACYYKASCHASQHTCHKSIHQRNTHNLRSFLTLTAERMCVVNVPAALPHYPLRRRPGQPCSVSGCFAEVKNIFPLPRIECITQPVAHSVTMLT